MNRIVIVATLLLTFAAHAQTPQLPPGVKLPPGVTIPPNAQNMTPAQAKAAYEGLDPATKEALKQAAAPYKAQIEADPGLKAQIKAWIKSMLGK
jgi:hypothetical protein